MKLQRTLTYISKIDPHFFVATDRVVSLNETEKRGGRDRRFPRETNSFLLLAQVLPSPINEIQIEVSFRFQKQKKDISDS